MRITKNISSSFFPYIKLLKIRIKMLVFLSIKKILQNIWPNVYSYLKFVIKKFQFVIVDLLQEINCLCSLRRVQAVKFKDFQLETELFINVPKKK